MLYIMNIASLVLSVAFLAVITAGYYANQELYQKKFYLIGCVPSAITALTAILNLLW